MRVFLATLILTLGMVLFSTNVGGETATSSNLLPNGAGCNQTYDDNSVSVAGVGCSGSGKNLSTGDTTNQGFDVRSGTGYEFGTSGTQDLESNGNITIGSSGSLENLNIIKNKNVTGINKQELKMLSTNFCYGGEEIYEIKNLKN